MLRVGLRAGLALILLTTPAFCQRFVGGGSTAEGDYLRGLGIAAQGLGSYNLNTARAESINVDSAIKLDVYVQSVLRQSRADWAKLDAQTQARFKANYEKIRARIQDHPEKLDVFSGRALNAAFKQLNDPAIQEASLRAFPVAIDRGMLRRIPFTLDEKGLIFSLQRLTARGKGKWPVAFQTDDYTVERKAFDKAIDKAIDEMIDGKIAKETIAAYDEAVTNLSNKLQNEYGPSTDIRYNEAKTRLHEMARATNLLKTRSIQPVMADLDRYTGKTVNELRIFMQDHNLQFAAAESADERHLYVDLYAAIDQMRSSILGQQRGQ